MKVRPPAKPKIALLVETSRGFGRQLLYGIARYSHLHGPWTFHITPGDFEQVVPKMQEWGAHGVIARIINNRIEDAVLEAGLPTVAIGLSDRDIAANERLQHAGLIRGNSARAAELAAEHLMERHFRHYAYVGIASRGYSEDRERGFCETIEQHGYQPIIYPTPAKKADRIWTREHPRMARWIADLPKPIGIMACNDDRGREVLDACQLAGLAVPEDVAVVGVDNDELFCELADPPLSSVAFNAELGGYQAAKLLDKMMTGRVCKQQIVYVEPLRVVPRRSSDVIALENRDVAGALAFIHQTKGRGITVNDIAQHVAVSRRYLEVRFRQELNRTILQEIQRVRLDNAKNLLESTDYSVSKIADLAGLSSASYLIQLFRQQLDTTPAQYRAEIRSGTPQNRI